MASSCVFFQFWQGGVTSKGAFILWMLIRHRLYTFDRVLFDYNMVALFEKSFFEAEMRSFSSGEISIFSVHNGAAWHLIILIC